MFPHNSLRHCGIWYHVANSISSKPPATRSVGSAVFRSTMRNYWPLLLVLIGSAYAQEDGGGYGGPPKSTKPSGGYGAPPPTYAAPPPTYEASPPDTITLTSTKVVKSSEHCAIPAPVTVTHVKNVTTTKTIISSEHCPIPPPVTVTQLKNVTKTKVCVSCVVHAETPADFPRPNGRPSQSLGSTSQRY